MTNTTAPGAPTTEFDPHDIPLELVQTELRKGLRVLLAYQHAEQMITELMSAKTRVVELKAEAEQLAEANQTVANEVEFRRTELAAALNEANTAMATQKEQINGLLEEAKAVLAKARGEADRLVADAQSKAATIVSGAEREQAAIELKLSEMQPLVAEAEATIERATKLHAALSEQV